MRAWKAIHKNVLLIVQDNLMNRFFLFIQFSKKKLFSQFLCLKGRWGQMNWSFLRMRVMKAIHKNVLLIDQDILMNRFFLFIQFSKKKLFSQFLCLKGRWGQMTWSFLRMRARKAIHKNVLLIDQDNLMNRFFLFIQFSKKKLFSQFLCLKGRWGQMTWSFLRMRARKAIHKNVLLIDQDNLMNRFFLFIQFSKKNYFHNFYA